MLDRAARQRRINRQLEALENDNFQDDPHAGLPQLGKRLPQFDDDADTGEAGGGGRGCLGKGDSGSEPGGPAFVWGDGEVEVQSVCVTGRVVWLGIPGEPPGQGVPLGGWAEASWV